MSSYGKSRYELILQPVSGKALPVYKGEVLRITQVETVQCLDFNCFNLHDYKEHMSVGHTRRSGFRVKKGDPIWSTPPRFNPMMAIIEMPKTCITDLLAARCHAAQFERERGFKKLTHTNCEDTYSECIGEYGLTPDDVHDSLNFWVNSGWDNQGNYWANVMRNPGQKGDYVDLLALMDVLAVPVVCGSGDVSNTSNYFFQPLKIEIFERSEKTDKLTQAYLKRYTGYKNQRKLKDFKVKEIRAERKLKPVPGYEPHYINFPLKIHGFTLDLTEADYEQIRALKLRGFGDDEEAVRSTVMSWYIRNRTVQILPNRIIDVD